MKKVLHYKTNFLNRSETFIDRLIRNHIRYCPIALCYKKKHFSGNLPVYEVPQKGFGSWINFAAFHSNLPLPFYNEILQREQPELIHAHFGYDAFKLIRPAQKHNIPLLVSFYGSDVSRLTSEFGWKKRYKKLASAGAHFIAATNFMKSQLIELGFPEQKISIVRFGLQVNSAPIKNYPLSSHRIMMVGRMVEKKGFEYGIRAISQLKKRGENTELNIFGDGPQMQKLVKLSHSLGVNDFIHFQGYQPIDEVLKAHQDHSILLAPSVTARDGDMEGLPNTILEAMAKETIVIATRHAAIPEVIEDKKTGFLVDERDVNGISNVIEQIFQDKFELNVIRENARQIVHEKHGIQRMIHEVETIYDQITH